MSTYLESDDLLSHVCGNDRVESRIFDGLEEFGAVAASRAHHKGKAVPYVELRVWVHRVRKREVDGHQFGMRLLDLPRDPVHVRERVHFNLLPAYRHNLLRIHRRESHRNKVQTRIHHGLRRRKTHLSPAAVDQDGRVVAVAPGADRRGSDPPPGGRHGSGRGIGRRRSWGRPRVPHLHRLHRAHRRRARGRRSHGWRGHGLVLAVLL
mmetsp:Transcript_13347/g.33489  ORF Transcript_13347/g.33489 Transcript_13347/m.33489 type:complete len:208 (+) Transcript_13347:459-1082(+)